MTPDRVKWNKWVDAFQGRRLLVVGDMMLDRYLYGAVRRISPEAPVPVVAVTEEQAMPGGASNVARNVQTLGGGAAVAGVIGRDPGGVELKRCLEESGVDTAALLELADQRTTVKTRIIAERQQVVRVDWDSGTMLNAVQEESLCAAIERALVTVDGVVIEDYGKGVVTQRVVSSTLKRAQALGLPVGYDPKDGCDLDVQGATLATPNRKEAYSALGLPEPIGERPPLEDDGLLDVGKTLRTQWGVKLLILTLGAQGMLLLAEDEEPFHVPTRAREVFDVSGAGDTVVATATLALAAGASYRVAAELANLAAGIVVAQLGTAPCTVAALRKQWS